MFDILQGSLKHLYQPAVLFFLCLTSLAWLRSKRSKSQLPLPPGPKPLLVIGNSLDIPTVRPWLVYDEWFKKFDSDIIHLDVFGRSMIILGSSRRCTDLFEKRSAIYSDRPRMPMILELMKMYVNFGFLHYGKLWKQHRKLFTQYFRPAGVAEYRHIQLREARIFTRRLLHSPEDFLQHIRHTFSAMIMDVAYGVRVQEKDDPYLTIAEEFFSCLNIASAPGAFLVDIFSSLKYVPSWFPGAGFKLFAKHAESVNNMLASQPWNAVKKSMRGGTAVTSVASSMIETLSQGSDHEEEVIAMNCAAVSYVGGADTTVSTVQSFFLAMAMFPEAQKKAQAELDSVLAGRFPTFEDRDQMPYIQATIQEAMRWQQVTPLAVPHASTTDDEYDGYFIPKGSTIIGSSWSILHDPVMYPKPFEFNPDRFLKNGQINPDVKHPNHAFFGFGRRMCPGRFFSDNSLYIIVATLLSVFDIKPPLDDNEHPVKLEAVMSSGLLSYPEPYKCRILPRSSCAEKLIRDSELEYV